MRPALRSTIRSMIVAAIVAAPLLLAAQSAAHAQIVALVNGDPITALDITQRMRLVQISTQKTPTRQDVLDELIEDRLKVQLGKRYISEIPKREIEGSFASIARRAGMSSEQFTKAITASGINVESFKARIHADFVWNQIVRGKFRASLQVGEQEVSVKLQGNQKQDTSTGFEYTLRPILFLVPKGSPATVFEARKRDAEGLRARFQNCEEGVRFAMVLPDVAVRDAIIRQSADLGQAQRDVLNNTPVGRLTPPDVTLQGVELFAVCKKIESTGETAAKREAREAVYQERYQALSKKYMKELRSQALIEIR